jgi:hypothetical protein
VIGPLGRWSGSLAGSGVPCLRSSSVGSRSLSVGLRCSALGLLESFLGTVYLSLIGRLDWNLRTDRMSWNEWGTTLVTHC